MTGPALLPPPSSTPPGRASSHRDAGARVSVTRHLPTPPPVVVVHRPFGPTSLHRAADLARRSGAALHVVVVARRPPSILVLGWGGWSPDQTYDRAVADATALRGRGLHVEVHCAVCRPRQLAQKIGSTLGGVVVT